MDDKLEVLQVGVEFEALKTDLIATMAKATEDLDEYVMDVKKLKYQFDANCPPSSLPCSNKTHCGQRKKLCLVHQSEEELKTKQRAIRDEVKKLLRERPRLIIAKAHSIEKSLNDILSSIDGNICDEFFVPM